MHALIALGSNLGDRRTTIRTAISRLGRLPHTRLLRASSLHETEPERPGDGDAFINAAALLETGLEPRALLRHLLALERRAGRVRGPVRGPRTLDLDLILYGQRVLHAPDLVLPHPRAAERPFVLVPAAEVAPHMPVPGTRATLRSLAASLVKQPPLSR